MTRVFAISALAVLVAGPALAQTATTTHTGPRYDASRTTTIDPAAGTYDRTAIATRNSDGATATRQVHGQRTSDGLTISGGTTGFAGRQSSFGYDRTRTANGATATGSYTGFGGNNYGYAGSVARNGDGSGYSAQQTVTGPSGATLYNRNVSASRTSSGISRTVTTTRAGRFRRR